MKLLVATQETQGWRANDFQFVPEGEPVMPGVVCRGDIDDPDGFCGCNRSLDGIVTPRAGTTFNVVELPLSPTDLHALIKARIESNGWLRGDRAEMLFEAALVEYAVLLSELTSISPGSVVEYRGGSIGVRIYGRPAMPRRGPIGPPSGFPRGGGGRRRATRRRPGY